jgi:hypothetical protein
MKPYFIIVILYLGVEILVLRIHKISIILFINIVILFYNFFVFN